MIDKTTIPGVWIYPDGRQRCLESALGRRIYKDLLYTAWKLQNGICRYCHKPLYFPDATADHIRPRKMGGGERDDRQENIAAVHGRCNYLKGSRRVY